MSNKANYEVTFQYDFDEENPQKFSDTRVKRVMTAHEGVFVSVYADYGLKDMNFNINTTPETLKTVMETVLKDAERTNIRMTVFAKKQFDLVAFNVADVTNREELISKLQDNKDEISYRRLNVSTYDSNEISLELNTNTDKNASLSLVKPILEAFNAKNITLDTDSIEILKLTNYNTKKKSSLDY